MVAPFSFSRFGRSGPLSREGDFVSLPYSTRNPIEYAIPELFYRDGGLVGVPNERSLGLWGSDCLMKKFDIWSTDWIQQSLYEDEKGESLSLPTLRLATERIPSTGHSSSFAFLRLLDLSPNEAHSLHIMPLMTRRLKAVDEEIKAAQETPYSLYVSCYINKGDSLTLL